VTQRIGDRVGNRTCAIRIRVSIVFNAVVRIHRHPHVRQVRVVENKLSQLGLAWRLCAELRHDDQRNCAA
jgi:hypothetical protein